MRMLLAALVFAWTTALLRAEDWTQFRGPNRAGVSAEKGLLNPWPDGGPPLKWKIKTAGLGFSSFAVVDGKLYTLGTDQGDSNEVVHAFDARTGAALWSAKIGPVFTFKSNTWGDGPRSTPSVAGNRLYALGGQGILVCLDIADKGKELWRVDFVKDLGGQMMSDWGFSESPLVDGDVVIATPGGKGAVIALDAKTGKQVWRATELPHTAPYTSPIIAEINGVRQYVQITYIDNNEGAQLNGLEPKTGKVLWSTPVFKGFNYAIASNPVVRGSHVFCSAEDKGGVLFEVADKKAAKVYANKRLQNVHGGVILVGDHLYGHTKPNSWFCADFKTGEFAWTERNTLKAQSGSLTAADGMLYLFSEDGEVGLVTPDPKEFLLVSSFKLPEMSEYPRSRPTSRASHAWSYPVIANGCLYLRDNELIYCYDIKK